VATVSSFLGLRLRLRGGDEVLGGAGGGSCFTVLGADADDCDADLADADPEDTYLEERDAIRSGIHELLRRRDKPRRRGCTSVGGRFL
jgi:hypothetical protein